MYETAEKTVLKTEESHCGSRTALGELDGTYGYGQRNPSCKQKEWKVAYYPEDGVTTEELMDKLPSAYSFEARAGWEAEHLPYRKLGMIDRGVRLTVLYEDAGGNVWYKTRYRMEDGAIVSDTEYILGRNTFRNTKK